MEPFEFTWIFVVGTIIALIDAYGIGANDVANSFATSVSSGSLTLPQACMIAIFTEFLGAFLLGSTTAETIKSKIIDLNLFADKPELLMFAMLCALIGSASWVLFATRMGWPVSTTHSIVGAIIGVGISGFGSKAVNWAWKGVGQIIASWFISPALAGLIAVVVFLPIKFFILGREDSFKRGLIAIPIIFTLTAVVDLYYIVEKGIRTKNTLTDGATAGVIIGCSVFVGLFCVFFFVPWIKRSIKNKENLKVYHMFVIPFLSERPKRQEPEEKISGELDVEGNEIKPNPSFGKKVLNTILHGVRKDVTNLKNEKLHEIHDSAVRYDDDTEFMFSYLQVITASMASFAHGSNDVANAVGPFATIYYIWSEAKVDVSGKTNVPYWILAVGGLAIDIGLVTYGYNIMRSLGNKITYHSPSRGFTMELAASISVLTASGLGWPVSTTHCITGSTAAVGLTNGNAKAVNWRMLAWCMFSWILTLPVAGSLAGLLFAFGTRSPSLLS
ncbi:phosphate-repressible phosphate permease [Neoconidiobolus thromboides FSU 785]|nr:phosphate-repressible phosphate permease [Neoconidiobolus thromboides FSU 785]